MGAPDRNRRTGGGRPIVLSVAQTGRLSVALRCAVPDANFPDAAYQRIARIGGPGPKDHPAADHKIVYDYRRFTDIFMQAGFAVDLLEYCDEQGRFHYHQWSPDQGPVYRSLLLDHRNQGATIGSVSLIIDARKPD